MPSFITNFEQTCSSRSFFTQIKEQLQKHAFIFSLLFSLKSHYKNQIPQLLLFFPKSNFPRFKDQAKMECVFGLVGNGFAIIAADTSAVNSILVHKTNEDKIMKLDSHKLLGASGEAGDRVQFTEFVQKNVSLYQFRNGIPLTTAAAANFTRGELATALRKNPYSVNIILAGFDQDTGPSLYFIDYIATLHKVDKAAFGYGSYFALSMMDRHYRSDMSVDEAIKLVDDCIVEIRTRLVVAPPNFVIKIVDKDGAREFAWRESIKDQAVADANAAAVSATA